MTIHATWSDGKTALSHNVVVEIHPSLQELWVRSPEAVTATGDAPAILFASVAPEPLARWKFVDIELLSPPREKKQLRFRLTEDDGQRLVIADPASISAIMPWYTAHHAVIKTTTRRKWLKGTLIAWLVAVAVYFAIPIAIEGIAMCISRDTEISMGKAAKDQIIDAFSIVGSTKHTTPDKTPPPLKKLVDRLVQGDSVKGYEFEVTIVDSSMINAVALPGGYIIVFQGLIDQCDSPEELAGVLAHEMAHVTEQHGIAMLIRSHIWNFLARMAGTSDSIGGSMSSFFILQLSNSYSQDAERQADAMGVKRMLGAQMDPQKLAYFFNKMEKEKGILGDGFYSRLFRHLYATHPDLQERQQRILNICKNADQITYTPALTPAEWHELKEAKNTPKVDI